MKQIIREIFNANEKNIDVDVSEVFKENMMANEMTKIWNSHK